MRAPRPSPPAIATAIAVTLLVAARSAAAQEPLRVPLGDYFEVGLHGSYDDSGRQPVGTSQLRVGFHLEGRRGSGDTVQVRLDQGGRRLATADCRPVAAAYVTRCEAAPIPATEIDARRPVELRVTVIDGASDAERELLHASLPVYATHEWIGNREGRPVYVERRQLRLDSALGLFVLEDTTDGPAYVRNDTAYLRLFYWDATTEPYGADPWSFRCRVTPPGSDAPGEWAAYEIGRPSPSIGPGVDVENRIYDVRRREAASEALHFQRYAFNASLPFSVAGSRPLDAPRDVDGTWECQLRVGAGATRRVVRELRFRVEGNVAQPHAAQSALYLGEKRIAATVRFDPSALPASFDPAQVYATCYGVPVPVDAPLVDGDRPRAVQVSFRGPPGASHSAGRSRR